MLVGLPLHAQNLPWEITQKIENDSLYIKWLPVDFEGFDNLLNHNTKVYYLFVDRNDSVSDDELVANGKHIILNPPKLTDTNLREEDRVYLSAFLEDEQLDENGKKYAFGMAFIKNISDQKFQEACLNYISISPFPRKKQLTLLLINNDAKMRHTLSLSKKLEAMLAPKEVDFQLSLDKKNTVDIEWKSEDYQKHYFAYQVEKSIGGENNFSSLKRKYLPLTSDVTKEDAPDFVRDDSLVQGEWHYYRVNGYDLFGRLQSIGIVKKIYVPKLTNALVYIDTIAAEEKKRTIRYSIINSGKKSLNISEVLLFKSENREKGYSIASSANYEDNKGVFTVSSDQITGDSYYYKVAAVSSDNDTTFSTPRYFFTLDQEPPEIAENITGKCDSLGSVSITWEAPNDSDIRGYRVYRANDLKDVYTEKTLELTTATVFKDTLRLDNLTPAAYYYITVVDSNYNHSEHSDTIKIIKPDTIAPSPALLTSISKEDNLIHISWERSSSIDLKNGSLIRKVEQESDTLYTWTPDTIVDSFNDIPDRAEGHFTYYIISEDQAGNEAYSNKISIHYESGIRPSLDSVKGFADRSKKQIKLEWKKANYKVFSYDIYRGKSKEQMELVKTIEAEGSSLEYVDRNIYINNTYIYAIKYITTDGVHSVPYYVEVEY